MRDSALRLQNRTIFLTGPFNSVTQAILRTLTELGSDVAYIHDQTPHASRYVEGLNEVREAHPDYGRGAYFQLPLSTAQQVTEALGRVAESFGRMDVLIDASPLAWDDKSDAEAALNSLRVLADQSLPYMLAKQRGRVIYLFEDECLGTLNLPSLPAELRARLVAHIQELAHSLRSKNVTINGLAMGVGEDYLLRHFAKMGSIRKSLEELQKTHPDLRLVESTEAGMGAAYLASSLSASLTGQVLRLTRGFHLGPA